MRTHATIGGDAISRAMERVQAADSSIYRSDSRPLAFLDMARRIARSHHERWDGSGYPDRLQETDIPLPARIMALADVFDALISKRVYKSAMPVSEAVDIIAAERGKHFDPFVVDAFLQEQEQFFRIARQFADQ